MVEILEIEARIEFQNRFSRIEHELRSNRSCSDELISEHEVSSLNPMMLRLD